MEPLKRSRGWGTKSRLCPGLGPWGACGISDIAGWEGRSPEPASVVQEHRLSLIEGSG